MNTVQRSRATPQTVITFRDPEKAARKKILRLKAKKAMARELCKTRTVDLQKPLHVKKLTKTDYHDMLRYGISEMKGEEKSQARMRLAIELGAKPPKKGMGNYKTFLQRQKQEKEEQQQLAEERQILQTAVKKATPQKKKNGRFKKNKRRNEIGGLDGQIGKYKHGIQFISRKDLPITSSSKSISK